MRVVGGLARGRRLKAPRGTAIRPTADRVREAIFDLLGPGPFEGRVLDLFSGTGALGIEALSRGFHSAVLVDCDRRALALMAENLRRCGFSGQARVVDRDVLDFITRPDTAEPFSLVLADPPYRKGLADQVLRRLGGSGLVAKDGRVVIEVAAGEELPPGSGGLALRRQRRYGDTAVWIFGPA